MKKASPSSECPLSRTQIETLLISSPIGVYEAVVCDKGIHNLGLSGLTKENFNPIEGSTDVHVAKGTTADNNGVLDDDDKVGDPGPKAERAKTNASGAVLQWLKEYFANPGKITSSDLPPVCLPLEESTKFERDVWNTLTTSTEFGKTVTYAGLAALIGNPKASRAVGTALKKNPVGMVIPCHRVIRSDGASGNYAGGRLNAVKSWLLDYEKRHSEQ